MNRRFVFSKLSAIALCASVATFAMMGMECPPTEPGGNTNPPVNPGNRAPRLFVTEVRTPQGDLQAEQGDLIEIDFSGEDSEDRASVRIFASTSLDPAPAQELPILVNYPIGPGEGSGTAFWPTDAIAPGSYFIFGEINDGTFDATTGEGNPPVRVTSGEPVLITPSGIGEENAPPTVSVQLPSSDVGLTNRDVLTVRFSPNDPNLDQDTLIARIFFDTDRSAANDATFPPLEVADPVTINGVDFDPAVDPDLDVEINIDLNEIPIRRETDEFGRPLPYFVRVQIDDGENDPVNAYAVGTVAILRAPSDVVDMLNLGRNVAGAVWQGFFGTLLDESRGSRTGSAFTPLGDIDGDGLADFAIVSETSQVSGQSVGEVTVIYGRERRLSAALAEILPFGTGRYAGVNSINTVGSFVPFPQSDPRYQRFFNTRGHKIGMQLSSGGSLGVTSVAVNEDMTGDGTPELLVGWPFGQGMFDEEDLDPCDGCTYDEMQFAPFPCVMLENRGGDEALESDVGNLGFGGMGAIGANVWSPFDPANPNPFIPFNVEFELDNARITEFFSFVLTVTGTRADTLNQPFTINVQLENENGPTIDVNILATNFPPLGPDDEPTGEFETTAFFDVQGVDLPVAEGEALPPSVYDGRFLFFVRPSVAVSDLTITVTAQAQVAVSDEPRPIKVAYFDEFPPVFQDTGSTESGVSPFFTQELGVVCPPLNRSQNPLGLPGFGNRDGHLCGEIDSASISCFDPDGNEDDLTEEFNYASGIAYVDAFDDMVLRLNTDGQWTGTGRRNPSQNVFGQPNTPRLRGGRFRGAWEQPARIYDPASLYAYTVDSMPDFDDDNVEFTSTELIVSAPGGGVSFVSDPEDLSAGLVGTYSNDPGAPMVVTEATQQFDTGSPFSSLTNVVISLQGTAQNGAVMQVGVANAAGTGFIPGTVREVLLWNGAAPPIEDDGVPQLPNNVLIGDMVGFNINVELPFGGRIALVDGEGTIRVAIRDDCAVRFSSFELTSATITLVGLLRDAGYVLVYEGDNYTSNIVEPRQCAGNTDGDAESDEDRPMSWPSARCVGETGRQFCGPNPITTVLGENFGDSLGFGHYAGDLNLDGVADFAVGSPGSDSDPVNVDLDCNPEPNPLNNNGKAIFIFGTPFIAPLARPCDFAERIEIRGSHDDDQFGRVQAVAGDMNGDGNVDAFVGAEGYDVTDPAFDPVGGLPGYTGGPRPDSGFVGVLFGGGIDQSAEQAIRPEEIGTLNYPGVKFVGGVAGARLGGGSAAVTSVIAGQRGQHGVSNAGDFNRDGFDDLLITAPGQEWPAVKIEFFGNVADGNQITITAGTVVTPLVTTFEFDIANNGVAPGAIPVRPESADPLTAQRALIDAMTALDAEELGVTSIVARNQFPAPLPDTPTVTFLRRTYTPDAVWVQKNGANIVVTHTVRLGVAYLVFGDNVLLNNRTFELPQDLNRRDNSNNRVLKGIVFVSAFEKDSAMDATPDAAPLEAVSLAGDVDGDGFVDILIGAPRADLINIVAPNQRRQAAGEAYLIYGNQFGLNNGELP